MIASQPFWDKVAARYAKSPVADPEAYEITLDRVRAHLSPSDRVLELGCGTGTTALALANAAGHITASDISGEMLRIGAAKAQDAGLANVSFLRGAPGDSALAEAGPYDVVMAFNLLHLLPDLEGALAQIAPLVKPGGLFISKTFCRPGAGEANFEYRMTRLALPVMQLVGKAPYVGFRPIQALEKAVEAAGFRIVETGNYPARPPRRFIVAKRV
ncbi:MAG: class I SAM-dependent methyltransferase [Roseovarius sp.]